MLNPEKYYDIIKHTPLTSIDIFFTNKNKFLVGKRNNNPAKGYLFTPGCRTYKNETLSEGIVRVANTEVGIIIDPNKCKLIGVYDHIYEDNFMDKEIGTHYVNSAYHYNISDEEISKIKTDDQHDIFILVDIDEAIDKNSELHKQIHKYVINTLKDYKKIIQ